MIRREASLKAFILAAAAAILCLCSLGPATASPALESYAEQRTVLVERVCDDSSKEGWGSGVILLGRS